MIKYAKLSDVKDCRNPLKAEYHIVTFVSYTRGQQDVFSQCTLLGRNDVF